MSMNYRSARGYWEFILSWREAVVVLIFIFVYLIFIFIVTVIDVFECVVLGSLNDQVQGCLNRRGCALDRNLT